jgi:phosphate transport system permease protein
MKGMAEISIHRRIWADKFFKTLIIVLSLCSIVPMFLILSLIIQNGILGTLWLIVLSFVFSVPLGVFAGIYLAEYRGGKLAYLTRLAIEILQGIPSIVIGIIAYVWVVIPMGSFSALSGGVALGIMMLPVVVMATEETLKLVPDSLREASLALGVPYSRTILKVILPAGLSGILSGILLGVARVAGETAPLLFTAFGSPFMNQNILKPISSLPLMIFNYATSPYPDWHTLAWGASFVLIAFVLGLNLITKLVANKWKVQF